MSHLIARAVFQEESLILLYLNSDKWIYMANIHAREKCSPVQALNPFPVLVSFLLPHFAVNPQLWSFRSFTVIPQQSGVQFFLAGTEFLSVQSLLTRFNINGNTQSGIRKRSRGTAQPDRITNCFAARFVLPIPVTFLWSQSGMPWHIWYIREHWKVTAS